LSDEGQSGTDAALASSSPTRRDTKKKKWIMHFAFKAGRIRHSGTADAQTFQVAQLWSHDGKRTTEVSHLIDRTYGYHSQRELRWHLAELFEQPVDSLSLSRV
jgi:hypothetical protein